MLNIEDIRYDEREKLEEDFKSYVKDEMLVFFGVCGNQFKLNDKVFEALEDPDDGYRSCLGAIAKIETDGIFFPNPLAAVKVVEWKEFENGNEEVFDGYAVIDVFDGHVWIIFGTEYYDSYYPCFRFDYRPKLS